MSRKRGLVKLTYHVNLRKCRHAKLFTFYLCFTNLLSKMIKEFSKLQFSSLNSKTETR